MGRVKRIVDPEKLQQLIASLEKERDFRNRSELYATIASTEWAKELKLSPSVIYLRVNEFGLTVKTPLGKVGNQLKGNSVSRVRKDKKVSPKIKKALLSLAKSYGEEKTAQKALSGSMKAAIRLKCVDCCGGDKREVRRCEIVDCPIYVYRPFQSKLDESEEEN